jgi:hypothetical protein
MRDAERAKGFVPLLQHQVDQVREIVERVSNRSSDQSNRRDERR